MSGRHKYHMLRSELIERAREREGLDRDQVAVKTRMSRFTIEAMEGGRSPITEKTIWKYIEAGIIGRQEAADACFGLSYEPPWR